MGQASAGPTARDMQGAAQRMEALAQSLTLWRGRFEVSIDTAGQFWMTAFPEIQGLNPFHCAETVEAVETIYRESLLRIVTLNGAAGSA